MTKRPRRVLIDFGANFFATSVTWFLQTYPMEFTEIHAFEVVAERFQIPAARNEPFLPMNNKSRLRPFGKGPPPIPGWQLERIKAYNVFVGLEDGKDHINATRWILEDLRLTEDDTVVVKMDIEGAEWTLLDAWLNTPGLERIIDELFVEVHYGHPSMFVFGWLPGKFSHTRIQAAQLFNRLRHAGFYAHPWP
eukprot:TRINITY_DN20181_c0_g1_i1.p1 TRINITY_DN20181_c0_g1~~TRINITY_DN20181_c0_g1_i1.p1  ORF type:complete len:201 (+),score=15.03 TRINITY_DN20181_c0_g1_i1:26-604(+)